MAISIYELINARAVAAYWETLRSNQIPYLGESLFPAERMSGLKLDWIVGYNKLPVALMPAAFDARPVVRDRGQVETRSTRMPFFREAMRLGEEDRQQLLTLLASGSQFIKPIIDRLFDDVSSLIDSAVLNPEIMRFSVLQTGTITMQSPNESGINVNYNYNFDKTGAWAANNIITLVGTEQWGEDDANPVRDILGIKRLAASKGITITRAIIGPELWAELLLTPSIVKEVFPTGATALSDSDLQAYLARKTGIAFVQYEKQYQSFDGIEVPFVMSDRVTFLPSSAVGSTYFGTTPEEADLMTGAAPAEVRVVGGGIAVLSMLEAIPVNVITSVSEIVLPSFEGMNSVFILKAK